MTTNTKRGLAYVGAGLLVSFWVRKGWTPIQGATPGMPAWAPSASNPPAQGAPPPYFTSEVGSLIGWPVELLNRLGIISATPPPTH